MALLTELIMARGSPARRRFGGQVTAPPAALYPGGDLDAHAPPGSVSRFFVVSYQGLNGLLGVTEVSSAVDGRQVPLLS